jgi:aldose 1-epimerase
MKIEKTSFGTTATGRCADLYTCTNARGTVLKMCTYGATIVSFDVADRDGVPGNVVLGFDTVGAYEKHGAYFGATIGRFGNRIAGGRFSLGSESFELAVNDGPNHLHGGVRGFDKVVWDAEPMRDEQSAGVRFGYLSPDGEEGYPGNLEVGVVYALNNDDELRIEYSARTDALTVVNLTNHSYWNLSAGCSEAILRHRLQIHADRFLAVDGDGIPIAAVEVAGSAMDFRSPRPIGERIARLQGDPDGPMGYDHNYLLRAQGGKLMPAARVHDPASGRVMDVLTTEPGLQFYSGNFLDGSESSGGYPRHAALCLETQHFPDSPNRPDFPSAVLEPGGRYHSRTVYRFSIEPACL